MSRIQFNAPALLVHRALNRNMTALTRSLERLSTGWRIQRAKDDPGGVVASTLLGAESATLAAAVANASRADQVLNVVDGALGEIGTLLVELEGLVAANANDAGLTQAEKQANQTQVDSILTAIDRIANLTSFQDTRLLTGRFDYPTQDVNTSELDEVRVHQATLAQGASIDVAVQIIQSAQTGRVFIDTTTAGAPGVSGTTLGIEITGNTGAQSFSFASGTTRAQMVSAINGFTGTTGVSAVVQGAALIQLDSTDLGATQFASVAKVSGAAAYDDHFSTSAAVFGNLSAQDFGRDLDASINGVPAQGNGLDVTATTAHLALTVSVDPTFNVDGNGSTFTLLDGGAVFNLGSEVLLGSKASLAFPAVTTGRLGHPRAGRLADLGTGRAANTVTGDLATAQKIVRSAITQHAQVRGHIGAFHKHVVEGSMRHFPLALEAVKTSRSLVRDADMAQEMVHVTRQQVLVSASLSALAVAHALPNRVLGLLMGLRPNRGAG